MKSEPDHGDWYTPFSVAAPRAAPHYGYMTTHTKRSSVLTTSGVALLLAGLLTGCSSGGDVDAFCEDAAEIQDMSFLDDVDTSDDDAVKAALSDVQDKIGDIDPPSDVKDDWETLTGAMDDMIDQISDLDFNNPDDAEKFVEATEALETDELTEAGDNVDAYMSENCEA